MSTVQIFGVPASSYVRTARMTCIEKGVDHSLEVIEFRSDAHAKLHPFVRVPAMKHGDVHLYETSAICHYIDMAFDGPALLPEDALGLARVEQWISILNCYAYADIVGHYLLPFIRNKLDESTLPELLPKIERDLQIVDEGLAEGWLAGDRFSIADLFWGPVLAPLPQLPHTLEIVGRTRNIQPWLERLAKRESAAFLRPQ